MDEIKLHVFAEEFCSIVTYLRGRDGVLERGGFLLVRKAQLVKLLDHNAYEPAERKLIVWRSLGWIDTDRERFTRRVRTENGQIAAVKISLSVYDMLQKLL